jgi:hypothetical protein
MPGREWWLICPKCGHLWPAREGGMVRKSARSRGKRVLARCPSCSRLAWARLQLGREAHH